MDVVTVVSLATLFALLASGVFVSVALIGVGLISLLLFVDAPVGKVFASTVWGASSLWTLTALPLFIWMGEILFQTKLSEQMFRGLAPWLTRIPGRLLHVNVLGCAIFAAVCGSSTATAATIGQMSLPELKRRKYDEMMSIGSLAGSATLGLMIPPSLIMIVYGVAAEVSIAHLFVAGIVPGLVLVSLFSGFLIVWALLNPHRMPPAEEIFDWRARLSASIGLFPIILLIGFVMGSIYGGWATATEAAALGVAGALLISWTSGSLNATSFFNSVIGATRTSSMIAFIIAGASFLAVAMGFIGVPRYLAQRIGELNLSPVQLILGLSFLYIILGCFLDGISMIVLTTSVIMPVVQEAGIDLLWFGIFIVLVVEMAQITPPVGFNLFVLQSLTDKSIFYSARAALPFFFLMALAIMLIVAFPGLVTWLPKQMR
jgi:tripartite ATP-independent transporter DctM subunit